MKPPRARQVPHLRSGSAGLAARREPTLAPLDGYVRVSRVGGRSGERFISPDVQEEQIRAYARARGHAIETVFCELDRSGTTLDRPLLQTALTRIESGQSGGLIVARLDRFARTALEALEAIGRIQHVGGEFISVEDGLDSSTAFGKAMMTILLALAELEIGRVRENWRSAQTHAVLRGVHVTGAPPFGYQRDTHGRLQPIKEQTQALHDAFVQRGFGALPGQIVASLRDAGARDRDGKPVSLRRANYLLRNPVYIGEARCGEQINPTAHPPIVSHSIWIAAQDPRTRPSFNRNVKTLLAGLTRCSSCGAPLKRRRLTRRNSAWHAQADYAYFCWHRQGQPRCPGRTCVANNILEPFVVKAFFRWLGRLDRTDSRPGASRQRRSASRLGRFQLCARPCLLRTRQRPPNRETGKRAGLAQTRRDRPARTRARTPRLRDRAAPMAGPDRHRTTPTARSRSGHDHSRGRRRLPGQDANTHPLRRRPAPSCLRAAYGRNTLRAGGGGVDLRDLRAAGIETGRLHESRQLGLPAGGGDEVEPGDPVVPVLASALCRLIRAAARSCAPSCASARLCQPASDPGIQRIAAPAAAAASAWGA